MNHALNKLYIDINNTVHYSSINLLLARERRLKYFYSLNACTFRHDIITQKKENIYLLVNEP